MVVRILLPLLPLRLAWRRGWGPAAAAATLRRLLGLRQMDLLQQHLVLLDLRHLNLLHLRRIVLTRDCTLSPLLGLLLLHEVVHGPWRRNTAGPCHRHDRGHLRGYAVHCHERGVTGRVDRKDGGVGSVGHDARRPGRRGGRVAAPVVIGRRRGRRPVGRRRRRLSVGRRGPRWRSPRGRWRPMGWGWGSSLGEEYVLGLLLAVILSHVGRQGSVFGRRCCRRGLCGSQSLGLL